MLIRNMMTSTPRTAKTQISTSGDIPNITPPRKTSRQTLVVPCRIQPFDWLAALEMNHHRRRQLVSNLRVPSASGKGSHHSQVHNRKRWRFICSSDQEPDLSPLDCAPGRDDAAG